MRPRTLLRLSAWLLLTVSNVSNGFVLGSSTRIRRPAATVSHIHATQQERDLAIAEYVADYVEFVNEETLKTILEVSVACSSTGAETIA